jgi:hypothetical protein
MLKTAERGRGLVHVFVSTSPSIRVNSDSSVPHYSSSILHDAMQSVKSLFSHDKDGWRGWTRILNVSG